MSITRKTPVDTRRFLVRNVTISPLVCQTAPSYQACGVRSHLFAYPIWICLLFGAYGGASLIGVTCALIEGYNLGALAVVAIASLAIAFFCIRPRVPPNPAIETTDYRQELADALPHVLWGTSADGRCEFLNDRYTETFGIPRLEAIRDQSWVDPIHPDDRPKMYQAWRAAVDSGGSLYSAHARVRMNDGSYRWMESVGRSVRSSGSGEVVRWFGSLVDVQRQVEDRETISRLQFDLQTITDEYEKTLSYAEEQLSSVFQPREIGWVEYDIRTAQPLTDDLKKEGVVNVAAYLALKPSKAGDIRRAISACRASKHALSTLGYLRLADMISTWANTDGLRNLDVELAVLTALLDGVTATCGIAKLADAYGKTRTFPFSLWITEDGVARASFFDTEDSIERAEKAGAGRQELARANRIASASALSTSLVHEMSQPLTAISLDLATTARLVAMGPSGTEAVEKMMERLRWNVQRLTEIGTKTREGLRPNRHSQQSIDIVELARRSLDLVLHPLGLKQAAVEISADSDLPLIVGDSVALQQLLCALLQNALEASSSEEWPSTVSLKISRPLHSTEVRISVWNGGPGIGEEHLALIFDPFFSTKPNRLGFGLTISQSVVESFGGTLSVKNRSGGGVVAEFSIPVAGSAAFNSSLEI